MEPPNIKTGDDVLLVCKGREFAGRVILASSNHRSLLVGFDGHISGFVGAMPLLWEETGYINLVGDECTVQKVAGA